MLTSICHVIIRRPSLNGRASTGFSQSAPAKDPRPIRDKNFQLACIKQLIDFLSKTGFDKPISAKILTAPSSKDFQMIFKYLYGKIDASYEFGKKFEDEVPVLIKGIRYPYANDISKSQLYAVGSMHAWPSLLALLVWMVELIEVQAITIVSVWIICPSRIVPTLLLLWTWMPSSLALFATHTVFS